MKPHLTKPITAFKHACEHLLNDSITRDMLTREELEILEVNLEALTGKFFGPCSS
jgi:hypothetical protein